MHGTRGPRGRTGGGRADDRRGNRRHERVADTAAPPRVRVQEVARAAGPVDDGTDEHPSFSNDSEGWWPAFIDADASADAEDAQQPPEDELSADEAAALVAAAPQAASDGAEPLPGVLYLVPTPLGHLGDLSPRARAVLSGVELLLCEDTRVSRRLTAHLGAHPRLLSCHAHNERGRSRQVVELLAAGRRMALVSDAGTPLISDPGNSVVQAVLDAGLPVCALPGPCAALTALSASGLSATRFTFIGFLPRSKADRRDALTALRAETATLLVYESPHRLLDTLDDLCSSLGAERAASLAHNLTKRTERHLRGALGGLRDTLRESAASNPIAGEWCLVISGAPPTTEAPAAPEQATVLRLASALIAAGLGAKDARGVVQATFGISKNEAYTAVLHAQHQASPAPHQAEEQS